MKRTKPWMNSDLDCQPKTAAKVISLISTNDEALSKFLVLIRGKKKKNGER